MRRTCWRPSTTTLFKPSVVPWKPFTNCQKKERSLSAPLFDACPLAEGNKAMVMGRTPTGRRHYDQTTPEVSKPREGRVPCPSRSTHCPHSPKGAHLYVHSATNASAISRNTHQLKTPGFPSPRGIRSNDSTRSRSSWNKDLAREQIRRFLRAQKKQRYPYRCFGN